MENLFVQLRVNYVAAHSEPEQTLVGMAELVFVYEKPTYRHKKGEVIKSTELERFATTVTSEQLDIMIKHLNNVKKSVDSLDAAVGLLSGGEKQKDEGGADANA